MQNKYIHTKSIRLLEIVNKPYWWFIAFAIFVAFPSLAVSYYSIDQFKSAIKSSFPSLSTFLDLHVIGVVLVSLIASYFVSNLELFINKIIKNNSSLNYEGLLYLKEALEMVVKFKSERFELECQKSLKVNHTSAEVFGLITKPDQQIVHLANVLLTFLEKITDDVEFSVRIIRANQNSRPIEWYTYAPNNNPPETDIKILQNPNSAVSICLRKKSIFIVEDKVVAATRAGGKEYLMGHSDPDGEIGSLLCYPIYQKVLKYYPLVLMISADKLYFKKSKTKLYKWILDQFALRIQLEYNLEILKEHCK